MNELLRRVQTLLWPKLGLTLAVNLLFWGGYGWLARHAVFPVQPMARTWLDEAVGFSPEPWAAVYLSQFLLTGLLPWLIDSPQVLRRYVGAMFLLSAVSFVVFLVWPVASPRPSGTTGSTLLAWIFRADGIYNAFPSLHAGFLVLIGGLGWRMFGQRLSPAVIVLFVAWAAAILYSTLATRQHYVWDLVAGCAVGLVADRLAWARFNRSEPARSAAPG